VGLTLVVVILQQPIILQQPVAVVVHLLVVAVVVNHPLSIGLPLAAVTVNHLPVVVVVNHLLVVVVVNHLLAVVVNHPLSISLLLAAVIVNHLQLELVVLVVQQEEHPSLALVVLALLVPFWLWGLALFQQFVVLEELPKLAHDVREIPY